MLLVCWQMGLTAVHLAARYGHIQVLDTLREVTSLRITSKKLGLYALHVAAHYGQTGQFGLRDGRHYLPDRSVLVKGREGTTAKQVISGPGKGGEEV